MAPHSMMLYGGCFGRFDYVEDDVDFDVCMTTFPQKLKKWNFRKSGLQPLDKSGF